MNVDNLIRRLKINDKIDESMLTKLNIKNEDENQENIEFEFQLDEWATINKIRFTEKLHIKFLKLWSILSIPIIDYKRGSCEWRIRTRTAKSNDIFIIKSSPEDENKSLLERENWIMISNSQNKSIILRFLKIFGDAIECYDKYYIGIEIGNFTSNEPVVQNVLNRLQEELFKNSVVFNTKF